MSQVKSGIFSRDLLEPKSRLFWTTAEPVLSARICPPDDFTLRENERKMRLVGK